MSKKQIERFNPELHRQLKNYDGGTLFRRVLWSVLVAPMLRIFVPRHLYGFRNAILRMMGAQIGRGVRIYPSAEIFYPWNLEVGDNVTIAWSVRLYTLAQITIREGAMISQGSHLCSGSHNYEAASRPLVLKPIEIGERAWVAADAFIGPGVTIGHDCIVGARSVVVKDVERARVVAGHPARVIRELEIGE